MAESVMRSFFCTILLLALSVMTASATDVLRFGSFAESGLSGWSIKSFEGDTEYSIVNDAGQRVLQAQSRGTASGLIYETQYEPEEYPILGWRWKISNTLEKGDSRSKSGDDYAARVYVVFPHWFFPKTRTLNYIWANRLAKDAVQPNAYTSNAMMIAVESGEAKVGEWVTVRRNIIDDYRRAFGEAPSSVGAIAIMTDTDNTGENATAWYGDVSASKQ